jgi:hypothetical protein
VLRIAVLALVGCNSVFGLGPTQLDSDGDGILDSDDNCPTVKNPDQADSNGDGLGNVCDRDSDGVGDLEDNCPLNPNPDQADSDGDGIGDICDTCLTPLNADQDHDGIDDGCDLCLRGPPDDEDGDGFADACDNCPGTANGVLADNQADGDGDGVGDACDMVPSIERRVMFDSFLVPNDQWSTVWPNDNGTLTPVAGGLTPAVMTFQGFQFPVGPSGTWHVHVGIKLPPLPTGTTRFVGVRFRPTVSTTEVRCGFNSTIAGWQLFVGAVSSTTFVPPPNVNAGELVELRASIYLDQGNYGLACAVRSPTQEEVMKADTTTTLAIQDAQLSLFTQEPASYTYVDIISPP